MKGPKSEEQLDSDLMDELLDAMSGRDADALHPPEGHGTVIEIHIKPGHAPMVEKESEDDEESEEGMLPKPADLDRLMKKGR